MSSGDPATTSPTATAPIENASATDGFDAEEGPGQSRMLWEGWGLPRRLEGWRRSLTDQGGSQRRPLTIGALLAVLAIGGVVWFHLRPREQAPVAEPTNSSRPQRPAATPRPMADPMPAPPPRSGADAVPLTRAEPSSLDLQTLLDTWLQAKASVLAGRSSTSPGRSGQPDAARQAGATAG